MILLCEMQDNGFFFPLLIDCHWMIPAGLWAGLILTLILFMTGVVCLKCKRRRKAGNT